MINVHWTKFEGKSIDTFISEELRATGKGDASNHIAVNHQLTNHNTDWDSAQCLTYSTDYTTSQ